MAITLDGTTGITTPGLTNTGTETLVNLTSTGNTTLGDATTDTLTVGVTGIVKDASGNVGIGTASPSSYAFNDPAPLVVANTAGGSTLSIASGASSFGQLAFANGTSGTSRYNGYIKYDHTSNYMAFYTNAGSERMRIDSSGNLLVGTTASYGSRLSIVPSSTPTTAAGANALQIGESSSNTGYRLQLGYFNDPTNGFIGSIQSYGGGSPNNLVLQGAGGNLLVGTTTTSSITQGVVLYGNTAAAIDIGHATGTATGANYSIFRYNGTQIGSITQSGTTAVLYNVTSDQRLKENIKDADSASALIDSLKVRQFDWKTDNTHQRYGFIAQELVTVVPEAVHQPVNEEDMMAVDYSKLVPMLVKEIQSLRTRLTALENK
jgi:Chaperone of endosialidase